MEDLEQVLWQDREYLEDYFSSLKEVDYSSGLKRIKSFKELLEDEEFDIDEYVSVYEKEQFRLKNTIYLINTGDESYDFSLDVSSIVSMGHNKC